tara:strand:- start:13 stop:822 length:810 start_codon:yes stop_codon:yes gene_type:complete
MDKDINVKLGAVGMASDPSLDLPPQIEALLNMGNQQPITTPVQSYQEGGMVQPAGVSMQPQQGQPMNPNMIDMQINQSAAQNPELIARVRAGIEAGLQSGEINMEDLNMAIELAKTVAQNPAMYPQVRQFVIQKGLATEEELPPQYDEAIVMALLIASKAMATDVEFEGQAPLQPAPIQDMKAGGELKEVPGGSGLSKLPEDVRNRMGYMQDGGVLKGPSHDQGGIPVKVAGVNAAEMEGGEYVIPKNVVKAKGTEFFDKMLANYEDKE